MSTKSETRPGTSDRPSRRPQVMWRLLHLFFLFTLVWGIASFIAAGDAKQFWPVIIGATVPVLAAVVVVLVLGTTQDRRTAIVRRSSPGNIILHAVRQPDFSRALKRLAIRDETLSRYLVIELASDGVALWRGDHTPACFARIPRERIRAVVADRFEYHARSMSRILLTVTVSEGDVQLPIYVNGSGFNRFGMVTERQAGLLAREIRERIGSEKYE